MSPSTRMVSLALLTFCCLFLSPDAVAREAPTDSLASQERSHLQTGDPEEAIKSLKAALKSDPDRAETYLDLGYAYLKIDKLKQAMKAFKEALKRDAASAVAQAGIAEVYYRKSTGGFFAVSNARKAVSAARRATRLNPSYVNAYVILGKSYERLNENYEAAVRAYGEALKLYPGNTEIARLFGKAYIEHRRRSRDDREGPKFLLDETTLTRLERSLGDLGYLPIAAQIYFDQGEAQKAIDTFEAYIRALPEVEQDYYRGIDLVGTEREIEIYGQTPEAERDEFLRRFWSHRDLDLLTEVNERLFEHYRRVWYARENFGGGKAPWDARGDIYIRYGDPDFRARSGLATPDISPAVEQVKERLALALYGPEAIDETYIGPVYPVRSNQSFMGELDPAALERAEYGGNILGDGVLLDEVDETPEETGEAGGAVQDALDRFQLSQGRPENLHHFRPVTTDGDMTVVPWESWVYANVGEGIEITFTDELSNGVFDYAPIPDFPEEAGSVGLHRFSQLAFYAPQATAQRAVTEVPDFYTPGGPMSGLGFSYDFADFRPSEDGKTRIEVYYAIDPVELGTVASGDTTSIMADCAVILNDTTYSRVYREQDLFRYRSIGHRKWPDGAFIPNVLSLDIPPGDYLLTIQLSDRATERKGLYRHRVHVEDYGRDSLQISDIQFSWDISSEGGVDKFRKGDVWVVPMATRAYREAQNAYVYYELYNLARNPFGETRYRITYTIREEDPKRPFNLLRSSIRSIAKLLSREEKTQVKLSFDQVGTEPSTTGYFELSLGKVKPGYNLLSVTVEDLVSGQTATKEAQFRYKK